MLETTRPDKLTKEENEENYVVFSDLIVHTVPINSRANTTFPTGLVYSEIIGLAHAQAELIDDGLVIRGAITIGQIERSYNVVFGRGLISAYELEDKKALFPRIIIDDALLRAMKTNRLLRYHDQYKDEIKYISPFIRKDRDGITFINYLGGMQFEFNGPAGFYDFLRGHKAFVEQKLLEFKTDDSILQKYVWLKEYHNQIVKDRIAKGPHKLLISN